MDDLLYHYTNLETFHKIILGGNENFLNFRATHFEYLNDETEAYLVVDKYLSYFKQFEEEGKNTSSIKLSETINRSNFFDYTSFFDTTTPFIVSFSEKADFLPMWNTYTSLKNGLSLGFKKTIQDITFHSEIKKGLNYSIQQIQIKFEKCLYHNKNTDDAIKRLADELYQPLATCIGDGGKTQECQKFDFVHIKHKAYEYEQEYRLIVSAFDTDKQAVHYFEKNGVLKPYINLNIPKLALKEIILSPTADHDRSVRSLKHFLSINGYETVDSTKPNFVEIKKSLCPYREM